MTPPRLLKPAEVRARVGMSATTIFNRERRGEFPRRIKLGKSSRWLESEVSDWIVKQATSARYIVGAAGSGAMEGERA